MEPIYIEHVVFTRVFQKKREDNRIDIYFMIQDQQFQLVTAKNRESLYKPITLFHDSIEPCQFCQLADMTTTCLPLRQQIYVLFWRLIEQPSIRLEWLYLPHVEKGVVE